MTVCTLPLVHRKMHEAEPLPNKLIVKSQSSVIQHTWHQECCHGFLNSGMQGFKLDLLVKVHVQKLKYNFLTYFDTTFRSVHLY